MRSCVLTCETVQEDEIRNCFHVPLMVSVSACHNKYLVFLIVPAPLARRLQIFAAAQTPATDMVLAVRRRRRERLAQQMTAHGARQGLPQVRHQPVQIGQRGRITDAVHVRLQHQPCGGHQQAGRVHVAAGLLLWSRSPKLNTNKRVTTTRL